MLYDVLAYGETTVTETGMAQRIQAYFIDDIDGSEAEGTVRFGLDGAEYEIDLSTAHAKELRNTLERYIQAARRVTGAGSRRARRERNAPADRPSSTEVRSWAREQGIEVKDRGRIPAEVVVKFRAATSK
jgi:Lsr2